MIAKTLAPFVALLTLTYGSPSPLTRRQDFPYYIKPSAKATGTIIDGAVLNAADGGFYIGTPTTTICPDDSAPCDTFPNITSIIVSNTNSTARMNVYVPGGQIAYVDDDGNFAYTPAHAETLPPTATLRGFTRVERFEPTETYATVVYKGRPWKACPVDESNQTNPNGTIYQVSTASSSSSPAGCIGFEMAAIEIGDSQPQVYEYVV